MSSFQSQYGIRLSRELKGMKWDEFKALLTGISSETALGRIVYIRSEKDPKMLKTFTPEQRRIRSEWLSRRAKKVPAKDMHDFLEEMKRALMDMAQEGR